MKQSNTIRNRREYLIGNLKYDYDKLNDLLYVYKKDSNAYSTVMVGDFHLELNKQGELVGIEVLQASDILNEYGISKKILDNIEKIELKVVVNNNSMLIFLVINGLEQQRHATITMNNLESPIIQAIEAA
ncbi:DUF2283 domain-containing protein [Candidatus Woesearchaeota archaeon]|nr:DUF2283 domain-containing protein [Candidatus Woesearchaeota archaeon]